MADNQTLTAKQCIYEILVDFQKKIADLSFTLTTVQNKHEKREKEFYLDLFEILDSFENVFQGLGEKELEWEKAAQRAMKSFRSIYKNIIRLLSERGVEQIEFPDHKAVFGLCKVTGTKAVPGMENEHILCVLRKGYQKKSGEVIRPAELITVLNDEQNSI